MCRKFIIVLTLVTILTCFTFVQADLTYEPPNAFERGFSSLLNNMSNFFYEKLQQANGDIDTIVYNGEGSFFNIKFSDGSDGNDNPIGMMGYLIYMITKGLALVMMISVLLGVFTKVQISAITKNKVSFLEAVNKFVFSFVLIFWSPHILNFCLDIVNMFVVAVSPTNYPGVGLSFMETVQQQALASRTLADAGVYAGSVGLSLYYVFIYGTRAMHLALFLLLFPVIVMYLNSPKMAKQLDEFISDLISTLTIQPFDALMFLGISQVFSHPKFTALGADVGFWKIILIMTLIPIRSIAKKYMGFTSRSAISDMAGLAGIMGIFNLARGVTGGIRSISGGISSGIGDIANAKKYMNTPGFGEDIASEAGNTAFGSAAPMSNAVPLEMPDITPHRANYGIDIDRIGKTARTPQEAYNMLTKRGWSSIAGSVGRGVFGVAGAGAGSALGLGYGAAGVINGAAIGALLGGEAGAIAGSLAGNINPYARYNIPAKQNAGTASQEGSSGSAESDNADFSKDRVIPVQFLGEGRAEGLVVAQPNQVTNIDVNAGQQGGETPVGIPGPGIPKYDVHEEFNKHLKNIPKEVIRQQMEKAAKAANEIMGDRSELDSNGLESWYKVRDSAYMVQQVDYALDKIKRQGLNIDIGVINDMSRSAKMQIRETILKEMQKYAHSNDVNLEDII